jgi:hypothetical protein
VDSTSGRIRHRPGFDPATCSVSASGEYSWTPNLSLLVTRASLPPSVAYTITLAVAINLVH